MTENVLSAARVLDLMELLAGAPDGVLLREATAGLNAPKSSTLMLLRTLVNRGYAERDLMSDRYVLTDRCRTGGFGWAVAAYAPLVSTAQPIMRDVSSDVGETISFGVFDRTGHAKILIQTVAEVEVRYASTINRPIPLFCTAIGRTLVAGQPEEEWADLLGPQPYPAVTSRTVTDPQAIIQAVRDARHQGYAVVVDEFILGGTGVAAPVLDGEGRVAAALNMGCITSRFDEKRDRIIAAVKAAASEITCRTAGLIDVVSRSA